MTFKVSGRKLREQCQSRREEAEEGKLRAVTKLREVTAELDALGDEKLAQYEEFVEAQRDNRYLPTNKVPPLPSVHARKLLSRKQVLAGQIESYAQELQYFKLLVRNVSPWRRYELTVTELNTVGL